MNLKVWLEEEHPEIFEECKDLKLQNGNLKSWLDESHPELIARLSFLEFSQAVILMLSETIERKFHT